MIRREESVCGEDTLNVLLDLVRGLRQDVNLLEHRLGESDLQRVAGQAERKSIDENIFAQLQSLFTSTTNIEKRNEEVRDVYEDVKAMIKTWNKYWKPLFIGIGIIAGAVAAIWRIVKLLK